MCGHYSRLTVLMFLAAASLFVADVLSPTTPTPMAQLGANLLAAGLLIAIAVVVSPGLLFQIHASAAPHVHRGTSIRSCELIHRICVLLC
jgi:hypothetical protein